MPMLRSSVRKIFHAGRNRNKRGRRSNSSTTVQRAAEDINRALVDRVKRSLKFFSCQPMNRDWKFRPESILADTTRAESGIFGAICCGGGVS